MSFYKNIKGKFVYTQPGPHFFEFLKIFEFMVHFNFLNPNQEIALLFILKPKIGKEFFEENLNKQQNRAQSPSSGNKNIYLDIF